MQVTSGISSYPNSAGKSVTGTNSKNPARNATSTGNSAASSGVADATSAKDTVVQDFLKYAKMNPFERMRGSILKSMGLSEESLASMSPEQRAAVEEKIRQAIEEALRKQGAEPGGVVDVSA